MPEEFSVNKIIVIGFDYKHSPLEVREKVAFTSSGLKKAYEKIKNDAKIKETIILSTCNRSEIYAYANDAERGIEYLKAFYADFFNISSKELQKNIRIRWGFKAVNHIFEVASGFKSMIIGEDQILGQVKDAYKKAIEHKSSAKVLNRLFLDSITTAKKLKTLTGISNNSISVSSIGIKLIEKEIGKLSGKKALIIGLGEMSKIAVKNLLEKNLEKIYLTNRTSKKILDLGDESQMIEGIDFKDRYMFINKVDIIISSTAAPHFVLHKDEFLKHYRNQPLCILDLAIPRDVDPLLKDVLGIKIFKIDDIESIAQENYEKRLLAREYGKKIISEDIKNYFCWLKKSIIRLKLNCHEKILSCNA